MSDRPVIAILSDEFNPTHISAAEQASRACASEIQTSLSAPSTEYKGKDLTELASKMPACISEKTQNFTDQTIPVSNEKLDNRVNFGLSRAAGLGYKEADLKFFQQFSGSASNSTETKARVEKYLQDMQITYTKDPKDPEILKVSW